MAALKGRGRQGGAKGYLPSLLLESVLLDPSRPEVARVTVVMVQARHTVELSLMVAPHEPTSEACEPTCSPIRVRPGAS